MSNFSPSQTIFNNFDVRAKRHLKLLNVRSKAHLSLRVLQIRIFQINIAMFAMGDVLWVERKNKTIEMHLIFLAE